MTQSRSDDLLYTIAYQISRVGDKLEIIARELEKQTKVSEDIKKVLLQKNSFS